MAGTAGGQAAALLSVVLRNMYSESQCVEIVQHTSSRLLSKGTTISSVRQLTEFADLLARKMFPIGFGNFIAKEAMRIVKTYEYA